MAMKKTFGMSLLFVLLILAAPASADDLFERDRPDPGIAMIHFPQSLTLVQVAGGAGGFDVGAVKLWLRKIDPARVVPVKIGKNIKGEVSRDKLKDLGKQYNTDLLLVFKPSENKGRLITEGLVYFVKQRKVHPIENIVVEISSDPAEQKKSIRTSLKELAVSARKIILSFKFEKRRSNY